MGSEKALITYTVFFAAQNSSYSGDSRFSTLSSSREDTLVGFPLNLSHPHFRSCRFCSMCSCMCKLSSLSLLMSVLWSFIRITVKVHLGAVTNMISLVQIYPSTLRLISDLNVGIHIVVSGEVQWKKIGGYLVVRINQREKKEESLEILSLRVLESRLTLQGKCTHGVILQEQTRLEMKIQSKCLHRSTPSHTLRTQSTLIGTYFSIIEEPWWVRLVFTQQTLGD